MQAIKSCHVLHCPRQYIYSNVDFGANYKWASHAEYITRSFGYTVLPILHDAFLKLLLHSHAKAYCFFAKTSFLPAKLVKFEVIEVSGSSMSDFSGDRCTGEVSDDRDQDDTGQIEKITTGTRLYHLFKLNKHL